MSDFDALLSQVLALPEETRVEFLDRLIESIGSEVVDRNVIIDDELASELADRQREIHEPGYVSQDCFEALDEIERSLDERAS